LDLNVIELESLIGRCLNEDVGAGDLTTESIVSPEATAEAVIIAREEGVIAGLPVAEAVFHRMDPAIVFQSLARDGDRVQRDQVLVEISGRARPILTAERLALNFLQRLSGIATRTARLVELAAGQKAVIVDTRKTTPGLRVLEKYAVRVGGGRNHRFGLYDAVLVKENHIKMAGSITAAVELAGRGAPHMIKIEVEVEDLAGVQEALDAGADIIMLDNMEVADMKRAVELVKGRVLLEASGGITEENIRAVASTGVDFISVGALTHSVKSLDISMLLR